MGNPNTAGTSIPSCGNFKHTRCHCAANALVQRTSGWLLFSFRNSLGLALGSRVVWRDPQQSSQLHSRGSCHSVDSRPALLGVSLADPSFRSIALRTGSMSASMAWLRRLTSLRQSVLRDCINSPKEHLTFSPIGCVHFTG